RGGGPRTAPAESPDEEGLEDVGEVPEREDIDLPRSEQVVLAALGWVRERLVRGGDLLEPLLGLGVGVHVRVMLAGELPVGPLDLVIGGVGGDTEDRVQVGNASRPGDRAPAKLTVRGR